ncbi:MAG: hypothetical protein QW112_01150, partial [Candidatus Micrarchaeia archaeon]
VMLYILVEIFIGSKEAQTKLLMKERLNCALTKAKDLIKILVGLIIGLIFIGILTKSNPIGSIMNLFAFVQRAEMWIVNISIAELQPFSIFNLGGWTTAMGRFVTGNAFLDILILLTFVLLIFFGFFKTFRKDTLGFSFLFTLLLIGVYTTFRGVRFTEFTSAMLIIIIGAGFGMLMEWCSKQDKFLKAFSIGVGLCILLLAFSFGLQFGQQLGPDIEPNWDTAWLFLKTSTPELSIVGTWWDPGHMIAGIAERRNMADGAHCGAPCLLNINHRITDAGKIMTTTNETQSVEIFRKYVGNSPKAYWIASSDLIGKFQWVQYFGTGCDARYETRCPLYNIVGLNRVGYNENGEINAYYYQNIIVLSGSSPVPIYTQNRNAALFNEIIFYKEGKPTVVKFDDSNLATLLESLKPLEKQLNIRFVNQTIQQTIWVSPTYNYIVIIPPNLRESMFTKMFMLEGQGLTHFNQVFRNEDVKIYEVIL